MDGRETGTRRSREVVGYWEVPWDYPRTKIPHLKFRAQLFEKMEKQGWRVEQILSFNEEAYGNITEKGLMRVFTLRCIMSAPLRRIRLEVPDRLVPWLLNHPQLGKLVESVS